MEEKVDIPTKHLQGDVETNSNSSSLNLSITPPLSDEKQEQQQQQNNEEVESNPTSISEHLSSIENDRSLPEIQVESTQFSDLLLQNVPSDNENISQEPKPSSFGNTSSNLSSNVDKDDDDVDNQQTNNDDNNVKSILEEMISNEEFQLEFVDENVNKSRHGDDADEDEEVTFNIFTNLNLDDRLIEKNDDNDKNDGDFSGIEKRLKDFEELLTIKDSTIAALTTELDSYRELVSNQSSLGTSTTEYKQLQEECQNRLSEFQNLIVHKDELIQKLTESLQQSTTNCEDLKQSSDDLKNEIAQLKEQLENTTKFLKNQQQLQQDIGNDHLIEKLGNLQISHEIQQDIMEIFSQELEKLKNNNDLKKLELKHAAEMEELRTYFEQKCADLEKNYSEEIFSQHSRKLSSSSTNTIDNQDELADFVANNNDSQQQQLQQNLSPGPGGDSLLRFEYTKKDLQKLYVDLQKILKLFSNYVNNTTNDNNNGANNLQLENLPDNDFNLLKTEINRFDLKNLFKYDLSQIQNKYHAELEILQEDYDNRLDLINLENEKKLKLVEEKYCQEIDELKQQLEEFNKTITIAVPQPAAVQQEVVSGDFEIDEVVKSYEQRLQEQIALAKIDLINSLENQIQRLVQSDNKFDDDDWPDELLRLKERFSEKYKNEMFEMEKRYLDEIDNLKNRLRQRSNNNNNNNNNNNTDDIIKECDSYKNQTIILRHLIEELLKYFVQCENELNNTIINDFINKNLQEIDDDNDDNNIIKKRVRFTPSTNDLLNLIDNQINDDNLDFSQSSIDLKGELGNCLEKLKIDANEILLLTNNLNQSVTTATTIDDNNKIVSLTQQLNESKTIIKTLQDERGNLEKQLDNLSNKQQSLEQDLLKARHKIGELIDSGRKEIISEGYGENGKPTTSFVDTVAVLNELQEKSRTILEHPGKIDQNLFEIIDNYLRITEKLVDEARKDREVYQQQIDAADKKYKSTCQFLEEQANEREQERDDAQKLINNLKEELRIRDKDRINHERVNQEVENLEQQIRDMSCLIDGNEKRLQCVDLERKEAIEKIFVLRDIIRDLENQIEIKQQNEIELKNLIKEFENLIKQPEQQILKQQQHHQQHQQATVATLIQIEQLHQQINELENELQRVRLNSEIAGSEGPIKQIRIHLNEFETTLDKRTKDLELHSTISTCCSSPSEDMSVRDVVNPDISNSVFEECEIPLQQLARLKEKLVRHSRAEDATFKRIQDLEMLITNLKTEVDDNQNERDLLKKQISDQLVLISSLQIRLDEQRIRAEHIEKQTNTSLEVRIYDLQEKLNEYDEKLIKKDKLINQLNQQIDEFKLNLEKLQNHNNININNRKINDDLIVKMQEEIEILRNDNQQLKSKLNNINILENVLKEKQQQLEIYNNLNLDQIQIDYLNKLKSSGLSISDLIEQQIEPIRRLENTNNSTTPQLSTISPIINQHRRKTTNETILEISSIAKEHNLEFSSLPTNTKANSTEKHVHFSNNNNNNNNDRIQQLENELIQRDELINDYKLKLQKLVDLEQNVAKLQQCLDDTETTLKQTSEQYDKECKDRLEIENKLKLNLDDYQRKNDQLTRELLENQTNYNKLETINNHLEEQLKQLDLDNKQLNVQIDKLRNDLLRQQNLVIEKEKIIEQITEDSRSLHVNLETIQNKLQETGNIVDLLQRLRDEQKKNAELTGEIHSLKAQLFANVPLTKTTTTTTDIVGQVQEQLNYSNYLDNVIVENVIEPMHDIELLQQKLDDEMQKCNNFEQQLNQIQLEDGQLINELRIQLDRMIDEKLKLQNLIDLEQQRCNNLEKELLNLKQQQCTNSNKTSESTDYRELYDYKLKKLRKECDLLKDNNQKLNDDLRLLKNEKLQIDTTLKSTQVLLNIKENENQQLNKQLDHLMKNEKRIEDELVNVRMRFEEKTKEIDEIRQDRLQMKRQMDVLNQKLKSANTNKEQVPAKLMEKIKEINTAVKDNIHLVDLVTRLNNEKITLEQRIIDLEQQQQQQQHNLDNLPFDDPTSRANYLFAKFLRVDSYRKALIFQKRYLLSLLGTVDIPHYLTKPRIKLNRFKTVALSIMAVIRMKYLVKRWHSGKRIIQQRANVTTTTATRFQLGQPVSSQNFAFGNNRGVDEWTGQTPPAKERKLPKSEPLATPNLVAKYVERFNQIQEKLKLTRLNLDTNAPSADSS